MDAEDLKSEMADLQREHSLLLERYEALRSDLESTETRLTLAIFDKIPMPVWACDRDCKIVFWNKAASRLYGYSQEEALGKDFVDLFVNEAEKSQARKDCADIVDNDRFIRNMADDHDKAGTTRKLVTQCFAIYDVAEHAGLQVEISYEVQDIDRLQVELSEMQAAYKRQQQRVQQLEEENLRVTRDRALAGLHSIYQSQISRLSQREDKLLEARVQPATNKAACEEIGAQIKKDRQELLRWEKAMRAAIMRSKSSGDLENLVVDIENRVGLGL